MPGPASSATHSPYMADPRAREQTRRAVGVARQHERRTRKSTPPRRPSRAALPPPQPLRWRRAPRGGRRARGVRPTSSAGARRARARPRARLPARDPMGARSKSGRHARRPAYERAGAKGDRADRGCWWAALGVGTVRRQEVGYRRRRAARDVDLRVELKRVAAGARSRRRARRGSCSVAASATFTGRLTEEEAGGGGRSRRCTGGRAPRAAPRPDARRLAPEAAARGRTRRRCCGSGRARFSGSRRLVRNCMRAPGRRGTEAVEHPSFTVGLRPPTSGGRGSARSSSPRSTAA